ncbi:polymorphic toxin type 35 domain-containing protein [Glutamicibacter sp. AOP5-A2-18]|uniref:polymorphic toxin type 35 domain-containing protein n=1 Tax=Glutamicibacter sp. AOP5-A2-18 TaxID=3457656 RepID=UPI004034BE19
MTGKSFPWLHCLHYSRGESPKHKWGSVGAKSREQVADLMGRAMAEGKHSAYKSGAMQAVYNYKGKTIVVTYSKNGGQVSNGWVR